MNKFFIDLYGCSKNQVDAEIIVSKLTEDNYTLVEDAEDADFIIINSCGFIESAKKEALDAVYNYRILYKNKKIILAGCLAQRYYPDLVNQLTEADGIFGNGDILLISEFVKSLESKSKLKAKSKSANSTVVNSKSSNLATNSKLSSENSSTDFDT